MIAGGTFSYTFLLLEKTFSFHRHVKIQSLLDMFGIGWKRTTMIID